MKLNTTPSLDLNQLSAQLHLLALRVVKTVSDDAGYADPSAARQVYKDALALITRHSITLALEQFDFDSLVLLCQELSAKRTVAADTETAADKKPTANAKGH